MTVEAPGPGRPGSGRDGAARMARAGRGLRPVAGVLPDGTPHFAPVGEVIVTGSVVTCHLCGRSFRSVTAHLRGHGWTKSQYCEAFGLERGQSLEGPDTRKLRGAAFSARLIFEPAVRAGSAAGQARARAGELASDAAAAARGRPFPQQRRRKNAGPRAAGASAAMAAAARERADRRLGRAAERAAREAGYADIGELVVARVRTGIGLATISREAGLHKDWLSRHLDRLDPAAAALARQRRPDQRDASWQPALDRLGFPDVPSYLADRHLTRHLTAHAIASEAGVSHHAVESALRRHGLPRQAHAAKRHEAAQRAGAVAAAMGFPSVSAYVRRRRAEGLTWQAIAAESGQPQSWLRRHCEFIGS